MIYLFITTTNSIDVLSYDIDGKAKPINTSSNTTNAILVEHENKILFAYQEMIKLTYVKARLKVIIAYDRWNDVDFANKRLGGNLKKIICQANSKLIEPTGTEYLLIIGDANEIPLPGMIRSSFITRYAKYVVNKGNCLAFTKHAFATHFNKSIDLYNPHNSSNGIST